MPLPALNECGVLPPGIHDCSLDEIGELFATDEGRVYLWQLFPVFLERLQDTAPIPLNVFVDGCFITSWDGCCDIDVIVEARDFEAGQIAILRMLVSEQVRKEFLDDFRVMLHFVVPGFFGRDYRTWFQRVKSDEAWRFDMDPDRLRKGIVRVIL